jgi:glycosyltransferase involved in cell wall biosynthesis
VTDIVTPYMAVEFEALARQCELTVIFCSATGTRAMPWKFGDGLGFRYEVIGGLTLRRRHADATDYYLSPRIFSAIARARPDGIVAAGYSVPTVYTALYCRLRGIPFVIHSEGTSASESRIGLHQRLARRVVLSRASAGVAISAPAADRFRELGVVPQRLFLAPYSTHLERVWEAGADRSYALDGPMRVLAVGRLIPRKGFDRLLRAMHVAHERGAKIALDFVGPGPLEPELRGLAAELGLNDVSFAGFVDQRDLPERYAAADAFAFPSLDDPFGVVLLEAMAAGLPVVTSARAGATIDLVDDGRNGLVVDPDDIEKMADALFRLATDEDLRARLGQAAHEATLTRTPDAAAAGYVRAVTHAIEHAGPAVPRRSSAQ